MADIFLYSGDGADGDDGSTWALAKATLQTGIAGIDTTNQRVIIDSRHSETAATINYVSPGTPSAPCQLLSVTQTGTSGISALTAGATITGSGTATTFDGSIYANGLTVKNTSASSNEINLGNTANPSVQVWENCTFEHAGAGSSSRIAVGGMATAQSGSYRLKDCTFKFAATGQRVLYRGDVVVQGGSVAGTTFPTSVFGNAPGGGTGRGASITCEGFDFSACAAGVYLHSSDVNAGSRAVFRDCKVPASWSGAPIQTGVFGQKVEAYNLWNATTKWRIWIVDGAYTLKDNTTIYKSGGYQDDATPVSWQMVTTASCVYPAVMAVSPDMLINNTTTGTSKTVTVDIVHDSATNMTDAEVWLEVEYLGTNGAGTIVRDCAASVIATAADQTASAATWTTTGMTNPNKQKLEVTFTPQEKGYFLCRVVCAKASKTLYIDPKPVVA